MLTRRKRQNLLFLFFGLLLGAVVCSVVFYFNVLKGFMEDSISSIQALKSRKDTVQVVKTYIVPAATSLAVDSGSMADSLWLEEDSLQSADNGEEDIILSDMKVASASVAVLPLPGDSAHPREEPPCYLQVEQWENPMHFIGYKKLGSHLVIYGLNIDEIELYQKNKMIYLKFGEEEVLLKESGDFIRFPASFLHQAF
ncbi:MAG: hypothetical protein J5792_06550 [Bacteroidales bacterium]|nr:hypothetical protein [Bacteroidales bacterium]